MVLVRILDLELYIWLILRRKNWNKKSILKGEREILSQRKLNFNKSWNFLVAKVEIKAVTNYSNETVELNQVKKSTKFLFSRHVVPFCDEIII